MAVGKESQESQTSAVAARDEPTRRRLYGYAAHQPEPVTRDEAAAARDLPRTEIVCGMNLRLLEGLQDHPSPREYIDDHDR